MSLDGVLLRDFDPRTRCGTESEDATIEFEGFHTNPVKQTCYWALSICTFGIFWLLCLWIPKLYISFNLYKCSLEEANRVCAKPLYKEITKIIPETEAILMNNGSTKYFIWRNQNWRWHDGVETLSYCSKFRPDRFPFDNQVAEIYNNLTDRAQQLHSEKRETIEKIFGENLIRIPVPNPFQLLLDEVLHPFYLFQLFSVVLWFAELYYYYAIAIIIISSTSAIVGVYQTRRNLINLKQLAEFDCPVQYYKNGNVETRSSRSLVPGDLVELKEGFVLPCDIILLRGQCVVNESMLTGESVPVIKSPVAPDDFDIYNILKAKHSKYTLFGGTQILQVKTSNAPLVIGQVIQTGFSTTKGGLVRSILYPKPIKMKFYKDSFYFIVFLFSLAFIGFLIAIYRFVQLGTDTFDIILRGLDVFTIAIPPALPIALTIGVVFAVDRLKKDKISCIAPSRVNLAGLVEIFCFDKTGTLTEDGLDVKSVRASSISNDYKLNSYHDANFQNEVTETRNTNPELFKVLSCCHSLALLNESLIGDSLEVKMFLATGWEFIEISHEDALAQQGIRVIVKQPISEGNKSYGILKPFDFSSEHQKMSTLCRNMTNGDLFFCTKGAPEVIGGICVPQSVPKNYAEILTYYTKCGFRVLGCAIKPITLSQEAALQLPRNELECDLYFAGFLIMQNRLKPETTPALESLNTAGIRSIMITGDNPLTACYVAVGCKLSDADKTVYLTEVDEQNNIVWQNIDNVLEPKKELRQLVAQNDGSDSCQTELAVTGTAFELLLKQPEDLEIVLKHAHIYARMKPDQKQKLVEIIEEYGKTVGMCGDGANDCGALKAADVGISLSEAEASIAAPFTSAIPNISCVTLLLREGRCALVTSFQAFKFMASYSLIQFFTVMILYFIAAVVADMQFLWIDLFNVLPLAFVSEYTGPYRKLTKKRPITALMSWNVITSLLLQNLINLAFQLLAFSLLYTQPWFVPLDPTVDANDKNSNCAEVSSIWLVANFQYIFAVVAYSVDKPFRKPFYTNKAYLIVIVILLTINSILLLSPPGFAVNFLELYELPFRFRLELLVVVLINTAIVLVVEEVHHYFFIGRDICHDQTRSTKKAIKN